MSVKKNYNSNTSHWTEAGLLSVVVVEPCGCVA